MIWYGRDIWTDWPDAKASEAEWIAHNIAAGHGYSFYCVDNAAWLNTPDDGDGYCSTAWIAPAYTFLMATLFAVLNESGRLALVLLNLFWFGLTCGLVWVFCRRFASNRAAIVGTALLAVIPQIFPSAYWQLHCYIGPANVAPVLLLMTALTVCHCIEHPTPWRGLAAGASAGLLALTLGSGILAIPVSAIVVAVEGRPHRKAWRAATVLLLGAAVLVLPWTLRNYLTFDELVPVRTGSGLNLHISLPALAQTYQPGINPGYPTPPWTAAGPLDATKRFMELERQRELTAYSISTVEENAPDGYESFNEAERDGIFLAEARRFAQRHPIVTMELSIAKASAYVYFNWPTLLPIVGLAALGLIVGIRERHVRAVAALAVAGALPYVLAAPLMYRYRYPVDPLLCVLSGIFAAYVLDDGTRDAHPVTHGKRTVEYRT